MANSVIHEGCSRRDPIPAWIEQKEAIVVDETPNTYSGDTDANVVKEESDPVPTHETDDNVKDELKVDSPEKDERNEDKKLRKEQKEARKRERAKKREAKLARKEEREAKKMKKEAKKKKTAE